MAGLRGEVDGWLGAASRADVDERARRWIAEGVDPELARDVARSLHDYALLDIIDVAEISDRAADEVGSVLGLCERLHIEQLLTAVTGLSAQDRWQVQARLAIRDDLHGVLRTLTQTILDLGSRASRRKRRSPIGRCTIPRGWPASRRQSRRSASGARSISPPLGRRPGVAEHRRLSPFSRRASPISRRASPFSRRASPFLRRASPILRRVNPVKQWR